MMKDVFLAQMLLMNDYIAQNSVYSDEISA